ncbi:family 1 glycosylhydrolase [Nonomuraea bangladeshensis]|uniref:Family 1 glycosylhydrolase n=1 Tax=Nonomuraea bangladeshensis TaxID=404385 RepID=A0ABV3H0K1_9ACTN
MGEAIADGTDVPGCLHWTLLDSWEWHGHAMTFGLAGVERETFERTPKTEKSDRHRRSLPGHR